MTRKKPRPPKPQPEQNPEDENNKSSDFEDSIEVSQEGNEESDNSFEEEFLDDNQDVDSFGENPFANESSDGNSLEKNSFEEDFSGIDSQNENIFDVDSPGVGDSFSKMQVDYEYFPNRSYIFLFGPSSVGKTVIIGSIYEYLNTQRGGQYGDTLSNLNRNEVPYEKQGSQLLNQFIQRSNENKFPDGTAIAAAENTGIPKHINFKLSPADGRKPNFEFCFMDMAGEDLAKIDFNSNRPLPDSIRTYIEDVEKNNVCFIYIIDPAEETKSKIEQIQLFNAFINLIDSNEHNETPILLLVSKWDLVNEYKQVEDYLKNEFSQIWGMINQAGRSFDYAEFSIGKVIGNTIEEYDYSYSERVFNWVYKNQIGVSLIEQPKEEGWLIRFFRKYL